MLVVPWYCVVHQADETGIINISDGIQEELINLSNPADAKGQAYAAISGCACAAVSSSFDLSSVGIVREIMYVQLRHVLILTS